MRPATIKNKNKNQEAPASNPSIYVHAGPAASTVTACSRRTGRQGRRRPCWLGRLGLSLPV